MGDRTVGADMGTDDVTDMEHDEILHIAEGTDSDFVLFGTGNRIGPD